MELYVLYHAAEKQCAARGLKIVRSLVGNYCTSLDMAGASVTLVKMDAEMTRLWDAPARTAAITRC